MFQILGKYTRMSSDSMSPFWWGHDSVVRKRLRSGTEIVNATRRFYPMRFPFPPADVVEFFRLYYGPVNRAFAALDFGRQAKLRAELDRLWTDHNHNSYETTEVDAEYLDVIARRSVISRQVLLREGRQRARQIIPSAVLSLDSREAGEHPVEAVQTNSR